MDYVLILLFVALIADIIMIPILLVGNKEKSNILYKELLCIIVLLVIHMLGLILQILFKNTDISPIYFDYVSYFGICLTPVAFFVFSLSFLEKNINIKKVLVGLLIIPIVSIITLWTNDYHHLFYKEYSIKFTESMYGPFFIVHSTYSYILLISSMIILVYSSIKKSGFFSKQTFLIVLGSIVPLLVNILGTLKIIPMSIYITPILFIFACICYIISIMKYKALNIVPVALDTVTNIMSDSFVVISDDGTIVEMNSTFRKTFENVMDCSKDVNLFDFIESKKIFDISHLKNIIEKTRKEDTILNAEYHFSYNEDERFFEVDIHPIKAKKDKNQYIGTLLLFKDITQHKLDVQELEKKQDIIVKQGQLVSIGELAGGVAHDINTPISAIKTGITILNQKEDREESEKEVLQRMDNCATKIITIVNSMRNQIRNLGGTTNVKFKVSDVINDIKVIAYHEFSKNNSQLNVNIIDDLSINGDPAKLGQVLTNLVINAVQAYGDKGGKVDLRVEKAPSDMVMIKVADYANGLDPDIVPYIFKNILTTKGTFGTGLGLYLAYSVIKGEFNGNITFDTAKGEGTTFFVTIPKAE